MRRGEQPAARHRDCGVDEWHQALDDWFVREILSHEAALMRYLARTWPDSAEIADLRQEIYVRVYEAAAKARPHAPKSYLFTTARNLMADRMRRRRVVSIDVVEDLDDLHVLIDEMTPERCTSAREDVRRLSRAFEQLPPRCREVVWMRKVDGLSQKEVAARLGISEGTVEKQVAKGIRRLADSLFAGDPFASQDERNGKEHRDPRDRRRMAR